MPEKFEVESYLEHFAKAAHTAGFGVTQYGEAGEFPLLAADLNPGHPKMSAYLSTGIHGDEPAGPLALLALMRQRWFDPEIAWHILPLLNPTGMEAGTRESQLSKLDLNRDFRSPKAHETRALLQWLGHHGRPYDLALCLHEDWEAKGFYLYEINAPGAAQPGRVILQSVEPVIGIDHSPEIDGLPALNGRIHPHTVTSLETVEKWPEQLYIQHRHAALSFTLETPSSQPLPSRVIAHIVAIKTAVAQLLAPRLDNIFDI
ncbi:MAG: M14 family metallocarboxypeptidase [Puniceicoccales bacterium]|jgi:hypothetical protein|nr:M14 family metallocarboxypeptidase [Puniceicoccales bacterium]